MNKKLDEVHTKVGFVDSIRKVFECVICRSPVKNPVVARCCQRIVGCRECVQRWITNNSRCPLWSVSGDLEEAITLKGIDDWLSVFRPPETRDPLPPSTSENNSGDDFEPMPNLELLVLVLAHNRTLYLLLNIYSFGTDHGFDIDTFSLWY